MNRNWLQKVDPLKAIKACLKRYYWVLLKNKNQWKVKIILMMHE